MSPKGWQRIWLECWSRSTADDLAGNFNGRGPVYSICYWANREVGTGVWGNLGDGGAGVSAGQVGVAGSEVTGELVHGRGKKADENVRLVIV